MTRAKENINKVHKHVNNNTNLLICNVYIVNRIMMALCRGQAEVYHRAPDGGWGYLVLVGIFLAFSLSLGFVMCHTLIYQALIDKLGQSASATAWVFGLQVAVGFCFSRCIII